MDNVDRPLPLDELFIMVCDYGLGGPFLGVFYSPSGYGALRDLPAGTTTWCWVKAEQCFFQILPQRVRDLYETQASIDEALNFIYHRLLAVWTARIGSDYQNPDGTFQEFERDGPNIVHTVPNTPESNSEDEGRSDEGQEVDSGEEMDSSQETDSDEEMDSGEETDSNE